MRPHDRFYPADFDGDGSVDFFVFNGEDWSMGYLELMRAAENNLVPVRR